MSSARGIRAAPGGSCWVSRPNFRPFAVFSRFFSPARPLYYFCRGFRLPDGRCCLSTFSVLFFPSLASPKCRFSVRILLATFPWARFGCPSLCCSSSSLVLVSADVRGGHVPLGLWPSPVLLCVLARPLSATLKLFSVVLGAVGFAALSLSIPVNPLVPSYRLFGAFFGPFFPFSGVLPGGPVSLVLVSFAHWLFFLALAFYLVWDFFFVVCFFPFPAFFVPASCFCLRFHFLPRLPLSPWLFLWRFALIWPTFSFSCCATSFVFSSPLPGSTRRPWLLRLARFYFSFLFLFFSFYSVFSLSVFPAAF